MRIAALLLFGPAVAISIFAGLTQGNPVAWGFAVGFVSPIVAVCLLAAPAKPRLRKADPAKVARLEVDLQTGPAWEESKRRASEAPTTVQRGPTNANPHKAHQQEVRRIVEPDVFDDPAIRHGVSTGCIAMLIERPMARSTDHCPRPESCVIAHPCRACGADRGQWCFNTAVLRP